MARTADKIIAAHEVPGTGGYEILVGQYAKSGAYFVARNNRRGTMGYVILARAKTEQGAREIANREWTMDRDAMRKAS